MLICPGRQQVQVREQRAVHQATELDCSLVTSHAIEVYWQRPVDKSSSDFRLRRETLVCQGSALVVFYPENYGDPSALDSACSMLLVLAEQNSNPRLGLVDCYFCGMLEVDVLVKLVARAQAPGERERTIIKAAHETWRFEPVRSLPIRFHLGLQKSDYRVA